MFRCRTKRVVLSGQDNTILTCLGSQWQHRIWFILPAHGASHILEEVIIYSFFTCIGNNQPKRDRRQEEHQERFRYVYPDRIELSFGDQSSRHVQSYQKEGIPDFFSRWTFGEKGWCSGERARLPSIKSEFDSRDRFCKAPKRFLHPERRSKISNLTIKELFFAYS